MTEDVQERQSRPARCSNFHGGRRSLRKLHRSLIIDPVEALDAVRQGDLCLLAVSRLSARRSGLGMRPFRGVLRRFPDEVDAR